MTCSPSATRRHGTRRRGKSSSSVWRRRMCRAFSAPKSGESRTHCAVASCRKRTKTIAVSLVALLDAKLLADHGDGFREVSMPYMRDAWRQGLAAIDGEAKARYDGRGFAVLADREQDALLRSMQSGEVNGDRWSGLDAKAFFDRRILVDVPALFYSHPKAWNEIGFGGPASPARLRPSRRRPPRPLGGGGSRAGTRTGRREAEPACRLTRICSPEPRAAVRPTFSGRAAGSPMREYRESEAVDFAIVGTGAGGGTLAALLAEQGFSVIAFDAGGLFPAAGGFCFG